MKKSFIAFLFAVTGSLPSLAGSFYTGSDTGCFYGISQTSCTLTSSKSTLGLGIPAAPISYKPASGFTAPVTGGVVDLGTFTVGPDYFGGEEGTFDIDITFTAPAGSGGQTYSASTSGLILFGYGGAEVTFNDPTTQLYTYPGGAFDLSLPDSTILIGNGCSQDLDATITPIPEPASLAGVGLGLTLLSFVFRRRRTPPQDR